MSIQRYITLLKHFDWLLFASVVVLMSFGLAALYSIGISSDPSDLSNFYKQLIFSSVGIVLMFVVTVVGHRVWHRGSLIVYGTGAALLLLVLLFGQVINGTRGWFVIGGFTFQVVELAKLTLMVFLAAFLSKYILSIKTAKPFIISGVATLIYFGFVVLQPDFGSGIVLLGIWFITALFAGANKRYLFALIGLGVVVFALAWFAFFQDYQRDRIATFLNPQLDPYGRGYHVRQATIAIGAGGLLGRGLGFGSQSQLKFIPASQTDFIFAVIAEELGFLGVSLILIFWLVFFYRLIRAAQRCRDDFASIFMLSASSMFFIHFFINIGMNIGLLPVTGIPLPFISSGGSFLLVSMVVLGLIQSMIIRNRV